jgi:hypothetical protein
MIKDMSFVRIPPSDLGLSQGGKVVKGRAAIGGALAVLTIGIEVNNGIKGYNAFWDIVEEQNEFRFSTVYLEEARDDVHKAILLGVIIPIKLATKEGLSALTTYVLGGRLDTWSNDRSLYENSVFLLDVKKTGDKIIEQISSKKETYRKR